VIESSEVLWVTRPQVDRLDFFNLMAFLGELINSLGMIRRMRASKNRRTVIFGCIFTYGGGIPNEEVDPPGSNTGETPPGRTCEFNALGPQALTP